MPGACSWTSKACRGQLKHLLACPKLRHPYPEGAQGSCRAGPGPFAKTKEGRPQVTQDTFPVLPLRDIVVFPHMIVPLFVGREKSVRALEEVMQDDKQILLSSQIDPSVDDPTADGIYRIGVLANVLQLLKLPDGTVKVLVEGRSRVTIEEFTATDSYFEARVVPLDERPGDEASTRAMIGAVAEEFEKYAKVKKNIPEDALTTVSEATDPAKLADLVSGHLGIEVGQKQELLETLDVAERLEKVYGLIRRYVGRQVEKKIKSLSSKNQWSAPARILPQSEQDEATSASLGRGDEGRGGPERRNASTPPTCPREPAENRGDRKLKNIRPFAQRRVRNYLDWIARPVAEIPRETRTSPLPQRSRDTTIRLKKVNESDANTWPGHQRPSRRRPDPVPVARPAWAMTSAGKSGGQGQPRVQFPIHLGRVRRSDIPFNLPDRYRSMPQDHPTR